MQYKHILLTAAVLAAPATALGINCRGSSNCAGVPANIQGVLSAVEGVNQERVFFDGQHIACVSNLCAFWQNGASGTAASAAGHIKALINHGCNKCGSDPISGNNVANGELTVNWVISP